MTTADVHGPEWFAEIAAASERSAAALLGWLFAEIGTPKSMLDVGCGTAGWLAAAQRLGVGDVTGVDGDYVEREQLRIDPARFVPHDLTRPLDLGRTFDLAISLEVGEHLPDAASATFVDNIARHADVILFSAAAPGQSRSPDAKDQHINEQWPDYWAVRFAEHGLTPVDVRGHIWDNADIEWWYRQNAFLYVRAEELHRLAASPVAVIHPDNHAEATALLDRRPGVHEAARSLGGAIKRRLHH